MLKIEITIAKPQLKLESRFVKFQAVLLALILVLTFAPRSQADIGNCSGQIITLPFTDVEGSPFFCFIAQLYFQQVTLGTSPTTYSPTANVTRDQMAAFLSRTQNSTFNRGSRRAALNQFWTTTPNYTTGTAIGILGATNLAQNDPQQVASDGADLWVANFTSDSVSRVRASDGNLLGTWTGADAAFGVVVAKGRVFVTGSTAPGRLYVINGGPGAVVTLSNGLGNNPRGIAFDGLRLWTANDNSVSIITPGAPFTPNNVGGYGDLEGILYDGTNIWVTELSAPGRLMKLDANGGVMQTITVGNNPHYPIFDGTNIWVPNANSHSVSVVRVADGVVLATLTGNGLNDPRSAAFDGQRILVTSFNGQSVSLFRAADFAPLGTFSTGAGSFPWGACSDGLNFWITLPGTDALARF